jgi:hypothetical protein
VIRRCIPVVLLLLVYPPGCAVAGLNDEAVVVVHVLPHESGGCDRVRPGDFRNVCDVICNEPSLHVDAFPVFFEVAEFQVLDFGLTWPGTYSAVWTGCSDIDVGEITWPGDCVSQVWRTCQSGPVAVPGFAEIYDAGEICVIPHSQYGGIMIMDCEGEEDICQDVYCAGIGSHVVRGPCFGNEATTWGGIKSLFK